MGRFGKQFALVALVAGAAIVSGAPVQAGGNVRHQNHHATRNPGFWGYGNYIGRHHRHGVWATPGGYPVGSERGQISRRQR